MYKSKKDIIVKMEDKLDKLLRLEKENNIMLRKIIRYLYTHNDDAKDFMMNYIANIISNRFRR